ncbi:GntR family transcriptional regulator [Streptomyces malaysiensis]|uniref:GntR family transcriptional regulator n=1 Tax=Streptomyces malaysiensis subsp. samsunensis TaxID=459658 RepID=A0A9X2M4G4_STRMQ|nr:GntR family transcriptional regulator [Streptomyces samsunensis]MCQ8835192.1 GntR family transcriptional regulator [Streptomyces samsunensis]WPB90138.1 GntR family transcriptional regulator [Streptomyces malaysiensis]
MTREPHSSDEKTSYDGSMSERVASELQHRIILSKIPVGTWLRHDAIAREFGISRTPVREALRIMAARGLVTIEPHRGARVNGQSVQDVLEIGVVRADLEGLAASLAAVHMDDEQAERMTSAWSSFAETLEQTGPREELAEHWIESNELFHSTILEASGNKYLQQAIADLRRKLPHNISFGAYAGSSRLIARNMAEHQMIAEAILAQDALKARDLMNAHIRKSVEATAHWINRKAPNTVR